MPLSSLLPQVNAKTSFNESLIALRQALMPIIRKLELSGRLSYSLSLKFNIKDAIDLLMTLVELPGLTEKDGEIIYIDHFVTQISKLTFIGSKANKLTQFL
jgi:hypothetical protein